jgi:hypothetical protein
MTSVAQRSFAGGEIAPALYGRADQAKYATGARKVYNFIVQRFGGVTNRSGSKLVREAVGSTAGKTTRLRRFVYNDANTYQLEFGDFTLRLIQSGVGITVSGLAAWSAVTTYAVGDLVSSAGVNYYAKTASLNLTPASNPAAWYAMPADGTYEIPTPYAHADVRRLQFTQSADVMTIFHPSYPIQELRRYSSTKWILAAAAFTPSISRPTGCSSTIGGAGALSFRYRVTAVLPDTFEESLAGLETTKAITGATQANPCELTSVAHGYSTGDEITIAGVVGMTQLNGITVTITKTGANTYTLDGINSTAYTAYSSGGTSARTYARIDSAATPTAAAPNIISWTAVSGALEYNVYKETNGVYGFIGTARGTTFKDINYQPSGNTNLATPATVFEAAGKYPQTGDYVQQRLAAAGANNTPEAIKLSRTGVYHDFSTSSPLQDDDAIGFSINGEEVNEVRHIVNLGKCVVFTSSSVWSIDGDSDGVIRPTAINPNQLSRRGASYLRPVAIGNSLIYVQARGTIIRDLQLDLVEGQKGKDLTIYAQHLFDGYSVVAWAYQENPHSVLWVVRSDGKMLGLTYVKEHDVWAWFVCETDGRYLDAETVPEGDEDALYVVTERTINGTARRFVERFASRRVTNVAVDAFFVDCGGTYDGRNTTATTMTLSGGITWAYTEPMTLTASAAQFIAGDVGNDYILTIGTDTLRCHVRGFTDSTHVTIEPERNVPAAFRGVATAVWSRAVNQVAGLSYLEGKSVAILADGNVVANGFDDPKILVSGGIVTIPTPAAVIHVGLPYLADLETLDWEDPSAETLIDKKKLVQGVTLLVQDTRGGWAGCPKVADDGTAAWLSKYMNEIKQRATESYSQPTATRTGTFEINTAGTWGEKGRILIRQRDPLPMTVLAAIPRGKIGG